MKNLSKKIYFEFVLTYLVMIAIVFTIMGTFSYNRIIELESNKIYDNARQFLDNQTKYFDRQVEDLYHQSLVYSSDLDLQRLASRSKTALSQHVDELDSFIDKLSQNLFFNSFADQIFIYNENNRTFLSNQAIGLRGPVFYNTYLQGSNQDLTFEVFHADCAAKPDEYLEIYEMNSELYLQMSVSTLEPDIHYIYRINRDNMILLANFSDRELIPSIALVDGTGNTIYELTDGSEEKVSVMEMDSRYLDLSFRISISNERIAYQLRFVKLSITLIFAGAFLLALVVALFFSFRITEPLTSMATRLKQVNKTGNIRDFFRNMDQSVNELIDDNSQMNSQLQRYSANVRNVVVNKLLNGSSFTDHEIHFIPPEFNKLFEASSFCVVILSLMSDDEMGGDQACIEARLKASQILTQKEESDGLFMHQQSYDTYALIFYSNDSNPHFFEGRLQEYLEEFKRRDVSLNCFVGGIYHICDQIYKSYNEAAQLASSFETIKSGQYIRYSDVDLSTSEFAYSIEVEQKLISSVISDTKDVTQILDNLFDENRRIGLNEIHVLVNSVILTVRRICNKFMDLPISEIDHIEYMMRNLENSDDLTLIRKTFKFIFNILSQNATKNGTDKNTRLLETIDEYIRTNFADPHLSITEISSQMDLSENYISVFYKQMTGMNISAKIEELRMSKAKQLLAETDLKVKEISEACGYSNLNTFYKAFKRSNGISAMEYRNLINS